MNHRDIAIIQIEPTSYCNARCPHCPRFDVTHHDVFESTGKLHPDLILSHINASAIIKNLDLSNMDNLSRVIIEGDKGDPMMHPEIEKLIDAFCQCPGNPRVTLVTNGSIRTPIWWAALAEKNYQNFEVVFSIDGLADTNHLYRIGLNFNHIMDNVSAFIQHGGRAIWKMLVFKHNQHQVNDIEQLSKDLGFTAFYSRECHIDRFKEMPRWPVTTTGIQYFIEPVIHQEKTIFHRQHVEKLLPARPGNSLLCPNLSRGHIYINHLNRVVPCCMMHFDTELKYPGTKHLQELTNGFDNLDLSKFTISEILQGDFFRQRLQESFFGNRWLEICVKSCQSQIIKKMELINDKIN